MKKDEGKLDAYKVGDLVYDANIYDAMNTDMADLPFYKRWLPKNKEARILELCCGTGRLTIPIAKEGYTISGVDITASMLEQAEIKAETEGLDIKFIEADIRNFDLGTQFDHIFIPFNSIHHLYKNEDLFHAFGEVKKHLKEGGLFLLDCFNPNIQYIVEAEKEQKEIASYTTSDGRDVRINQSMCYESQTQINRIEWHYFINGEFDSVQNLDMRLFFPQELDSYLDRCGFRIIHKFGSFEEEVFHNASEKQIFVCERV
ncbi:MAG: class I SAM-dependent methyltransferase [Bacteroidota bacterium]